MPPSTTTPTATQSPTPLAPTQVASINAAREANVNAGINAYSGAGAVPSPISASSLMGNTNTSPLALPTPTTPPAVPSREALATEYSNPTPQVTTAQNNENNTLSTIQGILNQQGQKSAVQANLESAPGGVNDLNSQIQELNAQIKGAADARDAQKIAAQGNGGISALEGAAAAEADRQYATKTLGLSAAATALTGQLSLAQDKVKQALSAEFDPLTSELDYYKTALTLNQDALTTAQKQEADQLTAALNDRTDQLNQQKQDKTDVYNVMLEAAKNGASNTTLNAILAAKNGADAITAAGSSLNAPASTIKVDVNGRQELINSKTGAVVSDLGPTNPTATNTKQDALNYITQQVTNGSVMSDGTPTTDPNGYITATALQRILAAAPSEGLTTADVLASLKPYIYAPGGVVSPNYGLNASEVKLVNSG